MGVCMCVCLRVWVSVLLHMSLRDHGRKAGLLSPLIKKGRWRKRVITLQKEPMNELKSEKERVSVCVCLEKRREREVGRRGERPSVLTEHASPSLFSRRRDSHTHSHDSQEVREHCSSPLLCRLSLTRRFSRTKAEDIEKALTLSLPLSAHSLA